MIGAGVWHLWREATQNPVHLARISHQPLAKSRFFWHNIFPDNSFGQEEGGFRYDRV